MTLVMQPLPPDWRLVIGLFALTVTTILLASH
jgi:hypothetical protein